MLWLNIAILSYFIFAVVFLIDKHLLISAVPDPKLYAFLNGLAGILILIIIPFSNFYIPDFFQLTISFLAGSFFVIALYYFFKALKIFDASQIVPAVGALVPLFSFFLIYAFSSGKNGLSFPDLLAFLFLIAGSVLITIEKENKITKKALKMASLAAFFFSAAFVLTKYVYLGQSFWNGLIWTRIGGFAMAMVFLISSSDIRKKISSPGKDFQKKTFGLFVTNQVAGAGASLLQNWAIALAPLAYLSIVNALQGVQYAFLFILATIFSLKFPKIVKEKISEGIIFQKIFAILLIGVGLVLFAIK